MSRPMQCEVRLNKPIRSLYETLLVQQLLYFQHYDRSIRTLEEGTTICRDFYTKIRGHAVKGKSRIVQIDPDQCFRIESSYGKNRIVQTFTLEKIDENHTLICYSENSFFEKAAHQTNYGLVSWFYTFFFRRQTRKRLKKLGGMVCG